MNNKQVYLEKVYLFCMVHTNPQKIVILIKEEKDGKSWCAYCPGEQQRDSRKNEGQLFINSLKTSWYQHYPRNPIMLAFEPYQKVYFPGAMRDQQQYTESYLSID